MKLGTTIKILGCGRVVRDFLSSETAEKARQSIEIYCKSTTPMPESILEKFSFYSIDNFRPSHDLIVVAVSTNEGQVLNQSKHLCRKTVAQKNLKIIKSFCQMRFFEKGNIFVLTNPVEIIAEYITKNTQNSKIYGLGQAIDLARMKKIYRSKYQNDHRIQLLGNHYLNPIPSPQKHVKSLTCKEVKDIEKTYRKMVQREFNGTRPPAKSGSFNLQCLITNIMSHKTLLVSGYCKNYDAFLFGQLSPKNLRFKMNLPKSRIELTCLRQKVSDHKDFRDNLRFQ